MTELLVSLWGQWPKFVGVLVALLVQGYRLAPELGWDFIPTRARPAIAFVIAGLGAFAAALLGGADWAPAVDAALSAWGVTLIGADTLRVVAGKPPSAGTVGQ